MRPDPGSVKMSRNGLIGTSIPRDRASVARGRGVYGLALHGVVPFGATFMVFHDYMRSAVRLSALQGLGCIWVYTHASSCVGEDGPTHQPIEHLAAMRSIPRLHVMRPGDANEAAYAWRHAIARRNGPTAMAMTRRNLPTLDRADLGCACQTLRGGYAIRDADNAEMILVATGSELSLAIEAADALTAKGRAVRVVSMPCLDLFQEQPAAYQESVLPSGIASRVVLEAGIRMGWGGILGAKGVFVGREDFGNSGPMSILAEKYGFAPDAVIEAIEAAGL